MNVNEIWKPVKDYEGLYEVSNYGRVKSIYKNGKVRILKSYKTIHGYDMVDLYKNKIRKHKTIHRLVSIAFIPNPEDKEEVNHINGIKDDNAISNLEWVTPSENSLHVYKALGRKPPIPMKGRLGKYNPKSKPVLQYNLDGSFVKRYDGICEAARLTGLSCGHISSCATGRKKTHGNFTWRFE